MRLQVKGKNVEVSEAIRSYAEQKLRKLERQLNDGAQVELELAMERWHRQRREIDEPLEAEAALRRRALQLRGATPLGR